MSDQRPDSQFPNGLKWVRDEIVAGLHAVRDQVERGGQGSAAAPGLADAVAVLAEVHGVLSALQLHGAACLVQELIEACRALMAGTAASVPETTEALSLALVQLPDYLDRLDAQAGETPLALLPAINDLRASRGDPPLSAAELLVPPSVLIAPEAPAGAALEGLAQMARKVRPLFYQHLLEWFRGADPAVGLGKLARLFNQLHGYLGDGLVGDLFRAAERLAEALCAGELATTPLHRTLIAGLDEIFKPLALSPPEWPAARFQESLSELVRCLDQAELDPVLIRRIRATHGPDVWAVAGEDPGPNGPMRAVGGEALAELAADACRAFGPLKDRLEQFVRLGRYQNPAWLAELAPALAGLAERLAMAGCDDLAARLGRLADTLGAMGGSGDALDEARLLDLAEELLILEEAAVALESSRNPVRAQRVLSGVDRLDLTGTVVREALAELSKAKQAITDATTAVPCDRQKLAGVPDLLLGCARPLEMLGEAAAVALLAGVAEQCRRRYLDAKTGPSGIALELIAEILAGVELHLEGLAEGISYRRDLLAQGRDALMRLGALPAEEVVRPPGDGGGTARAADVAVSGAEIRGLPVDAELREIFFEEARDEGQALAELFARWRRDRGDQMVLRDLRRSFHTLKGSGRLVGATQVAELARVVEALLNRIIDQGLAVTDTMLEAVGEAVACLPGLIQAEERGDTLAIAPLLARLEGRSASQTLAAAPASAPPGDEQRRPAAAAAGGLAVSPLAATDDVPATTPPAMDPEMAALFLEDARDLLERLDDAFRAWCSAPDDRAPLGEIQRQLHTLKGAARLAELQAIADLSHGLETLLIGLAKRDTIGGEYLDIAQRALDALAGQVDDLAQGRPLSRADQLAAALTAALEKGPRPVEAIQVASASPSSPPSPMRAPSSREAAGPTEAAGSERPAAHLRIRVDLLNQLVDQAAEMRIDRERMVRHNGAQRGHLDELDRALERLREQLRQFALAIEAHQRDGDSRPSHFWIADEPTSSVPSLAVPELPALLHGLTETVADLGCIDQLLTAHQREAAELFEEQAGKVGALLDGLLAARMVPFSQVVPRLERLVRQSAEATGKAAHLAIRGGEVELDRSILERLLGPFEHLLRNALAHGIEAPSARAAAGKPAAGAIQVDVGRDGNDVVITVVDDGAGMDTAAIRRKAEARGLLAAGEAITDDALVQLTLEPGFSTAPEVTQLAGRGVGLDAVMAEVRKVNGSLALSSQPGRGMTCRIRVPLTLAMIDVLLVEIGDQIHAVPYTTIEGVARIGRDALLAAYGGEPIHRHRGQPYRLVHLGSLLRPDIQVKLGRRRGYPLLLVRSGEQGYALQVDGLREGQRIVVKPLGPLLSALRTASGGTILPDGRVALVLDLPALLRSPTMARYRPPDVAMDSAARRACVMVVDDSLTTRRANTALLRAHGLDVIAAKDGVEALALLEERAPDLFLLDIDMPRMDGYELARHIRRAPHWARIPIIVSSSRAGPEHVERCAQLGVCHCFGKPFDPLELTAALDRLLLADER